MNMIIKKIFSLIISVATITVTSVSAGAVLYDGPYASYTYDGWDYSVQAPQCYLPKQTLTGTEMGTTPLKSPQDVVKAPDGKIYIADSGNSRIVVLNNEFKTEKVIETLKSSESIKLSEPTGLYVSEDKIYIADKKGLVYVTDLEGNITLTIQSPKHPLIAEDFNFLPTKILADRAGKIYVLAYGCYYGLMQFSPDGEFLGYYGANPVEMTPELYAEYMWKQIMSDEQRETTMRLLPVEYSNLASSADGFIYTTTVSATTFTNQIKKLNPVGNNILKGRNDSAIQFGDLEYDLNKDKQVRTSFIDVAVDENGIIYGLDLTRKRIFIYDGEGELLGTFGGQGYQKGTFQQPSAVEIYNNYIIVLDATKNNLTVFAPTEYLTYIKDGIKEYQEGDYNAAFELWQKVADKNTNHLQAQIGIGRSLARNENYEAALEAFKRGGSRYHYSNTFIDYRLINMRNIIPVIVIFIICITVIFSAVKIILRIRKKKKKV